MMTTQKSEFRKISDVLSTLILILSVSTPISRGECSVFDMPSINVRVLDGPILNSGASLPEFEAAGEGHGGGATLVVKNIGPETYDLSLDNGLSSGFAFSSSLQTDSRLAPGEEKQISVYRLPYPVGRRSGLLTIRASNWRENPTDPKKLYYDVPYFNSLIEPLELIPTPHASLPSWLSNRNKFVADFNGDGKDDVWVHLPNGEMMIYGKLSQGYGLIARIPTELTEAAGWTHHKESVRAADFDGDGKADLITLNYFGVLSVLKNRGTHFEFLNAIETHFTEANGWFDPQLNDQTFVGDVTGDQRADIVFHRSNGILELFASDGQTFRHMGSSQTRMTYASGWLRRAGERQLGDVTGDGKADFVSIDAFGQMRINFSFNNGFHSFGYGLNASFEAQPDIFAAQSFQLVDIDGDPRKEILFASLSGDLLVYRQNHDGGVGFIGRLVPEFFYQQGFMDQLPRRLIGDFDGNGREEFMWLNNFGAMINSRIVVGSSRPAIALRLVADSHATPPRALNSTETLTANSRGEFPSKIQLRVDVPRIAVDALRGQARLQILRQPRNFTVISAFDTGPDAFAAMFSYRGTYRGEDEMTWRIVDSQGVPLTNVATTRIVLRD